MQSRRSSKLKEACAAVLHALQLSERIYDRERINATCDAKYIDESVNAQSLVEDWEELSTLLPETWAAFKAVESDLRRVGDTGSGCAHWEALDFATQLESRVKSAIAPTFDGEVDLVALAGRLPDRRHRIIALPIPDFVRLQNRIADEVVRATPAESRVRLDAELDGLFERAHEYLAQRAEDPDEEAIVYLASRGYDTQRLADVLEVCWRREANGDESDYIRLRGGRQLKEVTVRGGASEDKAGETASLSWLDLGDQTFAELVSLVRASEWCGIREILPLLEQHARGTLRQYQEGEVVNGPELGERVFNLCRSETALKLYAEPLDILLVAMQKAKCEGASQASFEQQGRVETWNSHLAGFVFACSVSGKASEKAVTLAVQLLLRSQERSGAWKRCTHHREPDPLTTAIAVHALVFAKPDGWETAVTKAANWLWTAQSPVGSWESKCLSLSNTYVTVAVLDAIELATGGIETTLKTLSTIPEQRQDSCVSQNSSLPVPVMAAPNEDRSGKQGEGRNSDQALSRLMNLFTNGIVDERIKAAAFVLQDQTLTTNERLMKIDRLIRFPATASAEQLGRLLGVTKQAVMKTAWWDQNRKGEKANQIGRRQDVHRERAKQYEPPEDDE